MMGMKNPNPKRRSIIHIQNAYISGLENVVVSRETEKYVIAYEEKRYRVHYLLFKIAKELLRNEISRNQVDINVREDYRLHIKNGDSNTETMKNVVIRIVPTRYQSYEPLYTKILSLKWRRTGKGAIDEQVFNISECPMIVNSSNFKGTCYKKISSQVSGGGTHGTHTYLVASTIPGEHMIGKQAVLSNSGKTYFEIPLRITL